MISPKTPTTGYIFTLGSGAICWKSKKQTIIANSTMELATPFDSSVHLFPVNNDNEIFNQKDYASIIGSLHQC